MTAVLLPAHLVAVVAVTALLWLLPRIDRGTTPFGVRVPPGRTADPAITSATRGYRVAVLAVCVLSLVTSALLWSLMSDEAAISGGSALLVAGAIGAYAGAHRTIRRAKADGDWYAGLREGVAVDTGLRTDPVRVPWLGTIPSVLVIAATAITGAVLYPSLPDTMVTSVRYTGEGTQVATTPTTPASAFGIVFAQLLLTGALLLMLRFTMRAPADMDAARPRASADRHRRFLRIWARCLLATTFVLNATLGALALIVWTGSLAESGPAAALLITGPMLAAAALLVGAALLIGQSGWRLRDTPDEGTGFVQRDDDRYWHLSGFVYINRNDPALLVPKRAAGFGWTVNLGHPGMWILTGVVAAGVVTLIVLAATGAIDGSSHYGWQFGDTAAPLARP